MLTSFALNNRNDSFDIADLRKHIRDGGQGDNVRLNTKSVRTVIAKKHEQKRATDQSELTTEHEHQTYDSNA
jgi:hypothetical protein